MYLGWEIVFQDKTQLSDSIKNMPNLYIYRGEQNTAKKNITFLCYHNKF